MYPGATNTSIYWIALPTPGLSGLLKSNRAPLWVTLSSQVGISSPVDSYFQTSSSSLTGLILPWPHWTSHTPLCYTLPDIRPQVHCLKGLLLTLGLGYPEHGSQQGVEWPLLGSLCYLSLCNFTDPPPFVRPYPGFGWSGS